MSQEEIEIQKDLSSGNLEAIYRSAVKCLLNEGANDQCSHCRLWFRWKSMKACASDCREHGRIFCKNCRVDCPRCLESICKFHSQKWIEDGWYADTHISCEVCSNKAEQEFLRGQ